MAIDDEGENHSRRSQPAAVLSFCDYDLADRTADRRHRDPIHGDLGHGFRKRKIAMTSTRRGLEGRRRREGLERSGESWRRRESLERELWKDERCIVTICARGEMAKVRSIPGIHTSLSTKSARFN